VQGTISRFGRYAVSPADKSIVFHIELSTYPNFYGTEQKRSFELVGDELKYTVPAFSGGGSAVAVVEARKVAGDAPCAPHWQAEWRNSNERPPASSFDAGEQERGPSYCRLGCRRLSPPRPWPCSPYHKYHGFCTHWPPVLPAISASSSRPRKVSGISVRSRTPLRAVGANLEDKAT
jgi:hypothetical protein